MLLCDWQRICFKVSFDQVTVTRGLHCKRHVKAASWQITQNPFDSADEFKIGGFGPYYGISLESWTTAVNPHQNTWWELKKYWTFHQDLFLKTHISVFSTLLQVLAEEGHSLGSRDRLSVLPLKRKKKKHFLKTSVSLWQELAPWRPSLRFTSSGCRSQRFTMQPSPETLEAEPGSKGSYLQKNKFQFNEKPNSCEVTLQMQLEPEVNFGGLLIWTVELD